LKPFSKFSLNLGNPRTYLYINREAQKLKNMQTGWILYAILQGISTDYEPILSFFGLSILSNNSSMFDSEDF